MTVEELAEMYYGDTTETNAILKINKLTNNGSVVLRKGMTLLIPVTTNFRDQPELLGWVQ
jgi:phage tail protein X